MRKSILLLTLLVSFQGFSQQDAIYSQYMYNQFVINPAYAGSRNSMSAVLMHRTRWMGIDGAPTTSSLSVHSDLNKKNLAWGANFAADRLGPTTNVMAAIAGAYHLRLKKGKLAFGLRLGFFNSSINGAKLDFRDPTDNLNTGSRQSAMLPSVDFGLYYYTRKFYAGLSLNHMGGGTFNYSELSDATINLRRYNTLGMGYAFDINDNLIIKPSFLLKQSQPLTGNLDVNLSALLYETVWLGVSLRNTSTFNILFEINATDYMRFGYSFDTFTNGLNNASNGAHEIFVGFDFSRDKSKKTSPRYL